MRPPLFVLAVLMAASAASAAAHLSPREAGLLTRAESAALLRKELGVTRDGQIKALINSGCFRGVLTGDAKACKKITYAPDKYIPDPAKETKLLTSARSLVAAHLPPESRADYFIIVKRNPDPGVLDAYIRLHTPGSAPKAGPSSPKAKPAPPAAKPSTPKTAAAPKTKAAGAKPPRAAKKRHGKKPAAQAEQSPPSYFEKLWLTPAELKDYNGAIGKKKPKPSAADLARAYEKARAAVEKNLPPGSRAGYRKLVDERRFGKTIDEFLSKLKKPGTLKTRFTKDELDQLTKKERAAYDAQPNDEARARFIAAHQTDVDSRKAMKTPADRAAFGRLNDAQKEKFCEPFLLAGGSAAPISSEKSAKAQLIKTSAGESQAKGQIDGNAAKGDVVRVPKTTAQKPAADAWQREACADFVAHKAQAGFPGRLGPLAVEDKAPGENPPEEKKDKHFYGNLANAMSFGIAGLVLGAFFGGPLVMAAFAIAAGVGAYYMSKHINSPEEDKKGPAPKSSESKSPWSWLGF